jgi:hypothetical protein
MVGKVPDFTGANSNAKMKIGKIAISILRKNAKIKINKHHPEAYLTAKGRRPFFGPFLDIG